MLALWSSMSKADIISGILAIFLVYFGLFSIPALILDTWYSYILALRALVMALTHIAITVLNE